MVTMPSERELENPDIGHYVEKYLKGVASVPTKNRMRMLKFLQHWVAGPQVAAVYDEGALQVSRNVVHAIAVASLEEKKRLAKELAGVQE